MIQLRVFKYRVSGSVVSLIVNYAQKLWSEFRFDEKIVSGESFEDSKNLSGFDPTSFLHREKWAQSLAVFTIFQW